MLKYQKIIIGFILMLISMLIIDFYTHISIWLYVGIFLAMVGLLANGSINIRSGLYCKVLCSAEIENKIIALTFDDGPDRTGTHEILDILKKHNVKAAFFCIGQKAEENPEMIREIDQQGHVIGSHSYSHHFFFDLFGTGKMLKEMQKTENIINKTLNKNIKMFRPPYGVTNPPLARALKKMNYHVIGWSLRSKDTIIKKEKLLFDRLTKRIKAGDIVLFHDTAYHNFNVIELFIIFAKENNYRFERPDKMLNIEAYG
jgi:peptidoglycan/xylan/chitin deacetylase (PgdA/CDA1 family)